jgi:hypothetical protein
MDFMLFEAVSIYQLSFLFVEHVLCAHIMLSGKGCGRVVLGVFFVTCRNQLR